jgi:N6-L-threonylcarbamoyladenine synthase
LLVSGGNTALVVVKNPSKFITLGSTIDDSAGECFDKVAKA